MLFFAVTCNSTSFGEAVMALKTLCGDPAGPQPRRRRHTFELRLLKGGVDAGTLTGDIAIEWE